jgi:hypothetical protein
VPTGIISPVMLAAMPPKYSSASAAEVASATSVSDRGLPVSIVSSVLRSWLRSRIRSAARRRMRPRSTPLSAAHAFCASRAALRAASMIAGVASCSVAMTAPVAG